MHAYGYNKDTNNQSYTLMLLVQDVEKTKVKIEISSVGSNTAPDLPWLPPHD